MVNHSSRTALVTGCSSGIGRQAALRLHQVGLVVYATARRPGTLTELAENGIHVLALDVTDEASMVAAVETVAASRGQVDVLVNCAGFELAGPVEETPAAQVRRQFDPDRQHLLGVRPVRRARRSVLRRLQACRGRLQRGTAAGAGRLRRPGRAGRTGRGPRPAERQHRLGSRWRRRPLRKVPQGPEPLACPDLRRAAAQHRRAACGLR